MSINTFDWSDNNSQTRGPMNHITIGWGRLAFTWDTNSIPKIRNILRLLKHVSSLSTFPWPWCLPPAWHPKATSKLRPHLDWVIIPFKTRRILYRVKIYPPPTTSPCMMINSSFDIIPTMLTLTWPPPHFPRLLCHPVINHTEELIKGGTNHARLQQPPTGVSSGCIISPNGAYFPQQRPRWNPPCSSLRQREEARNKRRQNKFYRPLYCSRQQPISRIQRSWCQWPLPPHKRCHGADPYAGRHQHHPNGLHVEDRNHDTITAQDCQVLHPGPGRAHVAIQHFCPNYACTRISLAHFSASQCL